MATLYLSFSREEIKEQIPYAIVAETMSSSKWNTGRRKRLMKEQFIEPEIDIIYRLGKQAHRWHLTTGVPEELKLTLHTFQMWTRLANFCAEL